MKNNVYEAQMRWRGRQDAYEEVASMCIELSWRQDELEGFVFSSNDTRRAEFSDALSDEDLKVLGVCECGTIHHLDGGFRSCHE